jgi:hypothetical protein
MRQSRTGGTMADRRRSAVVALGGPPSAAQAPPERITAGTAGAFRVGGTSQATACSPRPDRVGAPCFAGIETTLIFHQDLDLPAFAAFDLLKTDEGT